MTNEEIKKVEGLMRSIKDFPAPGIIFRDITTILKDKEGLQIIINDFTEYKKDFLELSQKKSLKFFKLNFYIPKIFQIIIIFVQKFFNFTIIFF